MADDSKATGDDAGSSSSGRTEDGVPGEDLALGEGMLGDLDLGDTGLDSADGAVEAVTSPPDADKAKPAKPRSGARRRLGGLLALLLGIIGSLAMIVLAFLIVRLGFGASDTVDLALEPVRVSFDRLEDRIDQTDDLVDRNGIDAEVVDELQARVDGLVDVSTAAHQGFEAVEDHPVYSLLPAELSVLADDLELYETSAIEIDELIGDGEPAASASAAVADRLDQMQGNVSDVRDRIDEAASSLRRWIRIGALGGFLAALWGLWAQIALTKRGWRGLRPAR